MSTKRGWVTVPAVRAYRPSALQRLSQGLHLRMTKLSESALASQLNAGEIVTQASGWAPAAEQFSNEAGGKVNVSSSLFWTFCTTLCSREGREPDSTVPQPKTAL